MTIEQIYEQVIKPLPIAEQLRLVERIAHQLSQPVDGEPKKRRSWSEIRGVVPYPMCGEDAQEWVSRTRRESDEQREVHRREST